VSRPVGYELAELYSYLYKVDRSDVALAPRERAAATVLPDRWVEEGCVPDRPYLVTDHAALVRSCGALLAAVHR
jgi:hypothetical protein